MTIDGIEVQVPKGTLAIRAAEMIGIAIPRFCDHPLLDPVGACRQCLVEVPDMGNGRGMPKPQASCTLEVAPGMQIKTQLTSPVAAKSQKGMLEFLLINHPLDCPICDKGGECPLQNQALANGAGESRYEGVKRTFPKPVPISAQILLDRERCVLCARCTRFSEQISGDPFIALVERGALQQVGMYADHPYDSYFSGNVVQICPVGALTSAAYRFQSRPFDLVSTEVTCEHCASGCHLRSDQRHFQVKRRLAAEAPEVNEEWNCDKGRFAFVSARGEDRITRPLIREDGVLRIASWPEAIDAAVAGLAAAGSSAGVLTGGRLTMEDAYGYSKFARAVLGTNSIDFRSRPAGADEAAFLATRVAGRTRRPGRHLRRPREGRARRAGRLRAGGRVTAGVPAAPQGCPQERPEGDGDRSLRHHRHREAERNAGGDGPRRRGRGPRRARTRTRQRDPGGGARSARSRGTRRCRRPGRRLRREAGLGAASRR